MSSSEVGFYRVEQIINLIGISKSTWWLWVQKGKAPKGLKISEGVTVWPRKKIHEYLEGLALVADEAKTKKTKEIYKDEYTYIEDLAKRATKGQWFAVGRQVENSSDTLPDICFCDFAEDQKQDVINAEYIAAVQPKVIINMIKALRWYGENYKA